MNIAEILNNRAQNSPSKTAVIFRGEKITFKQLKESSFLLASALKKLGLKKGDKVAIYLPSWPEYIFSYLAAWINGATSVPLDFMLTEDELVSCISHSETKLLIMKPKANLSVSNLKNRCPDLKQVITCQDKEEGCLFFEELLKETKTESPRLK